MADENRTSDVVDLVACHAWKHESSMGASTPIGSQVGVHPCKGIRSLLQLGVVSKHAWEEEDRPFCNEQGISIACTIALSMSARIKAILTTHFTTTHASMILNYGQAEKHALSTNLLTNI